LKTPAPQRAASRKKLAAQDQALPDGSFPIPSVPYLVKAIRSVGRAPASKRPALKALIVKRAKQLKATNAPGVRNTWPFQAASDTEAIEMAAAAKTPPPDAHAQHQAHVAHLQHQVATGKATPAQKAELAKATAGSGSSGTGQPRVPAGSPSGGQFGSNSGGTTTKKTTAAKKTTTKKAAVAKPVVNKKNGTVTATINGKKVTMTLHQWHVLHVAHQQAAGVKAANDDTEALEMATATAKRLPMVRGAADIQLSRSGPGTITAMHKSSGRKIGTITPKGRGYTGTHADGKATGASGGQQGALAGLIAYHNGLARNPAESAASLANGARALDLAGALPVSTPANSSSDGPRVTSMGGSGSGKAPAGSPSGLSPYAAALYKKFIARKMKPAVALAFAKRADAMHNKAAKAA